MHSHLIPHQHPGCLDVMMALKDCHDKGFIHKALGKCNQEKIKVNECFAEERKEKTRAHRAVALEKKKKMEKIWKEIEEENS